MPGIRQKIVLRLFTPCPVGRGAEGFDVSPDGTQIWAANAQDGTISIIDVASKKVIDTVAANVDTTLNVHTQVLDGSVRDAVEKIGGELFAIVHRPEQAGALTD